MKIFSVCKCIYQVWGSWVLELQLLSSGLSPRSLRRLCQVRLDLVKPSIPPILFVFLNSSRFVKVRLSCQNQNRPRVGFQVEALTQGIVLLKDELNAEILSGCRRNSSKHSSVPKDSGRS